MLRQDRDPHEESAHLGDSHPASGVARDDLLLAAALASRRDAPDALDAAILAGATHKEPLSKPLRCQRFSTPSIRSASGPKPRSRATATAVLVAKGAPQVIVDLCAVGRRRAHARSPLRSTTPRPRASAPLGVARTVRADGSRFLGLLPLFDPPRDDSPRRSWRGAAMGVDIKMVTGDHERSRARSPAARSRAEHRRRRDRLRRGRTRRKSAAHPRRRASPVSSPSTSSRSSRRCKAPAISSA